jgi:hypothetical protein
MLAALINDLNRLADDLNALLVRHAAITFFTFGCAIWLLHFFRQTRKIILFLVLLLIASFAIFIVLARTREPADVLEITSVLFLYGMCLFIIICDLMMWRGAILVTRWRGDKWTKELDYVYLTIGSVGIAGTLNRLDFLPDRAAWADIIAPVVLATAVVIRFIKTRAEIEGWNKTTFHNSSTVSQPPSSSSFSQRASSASHTSPESAAEPPGTAP